MWPSFQGERTLTVFEVELSGKVKTRSTPPSFEPLWWPPVRTQTSANPPRKTPRVTARLMVRGRIGGSGVDQARDKILLPSASPRQGFRRVRPREARGRWGDG